MTAVTETSAVPGRFAIRGRAAAVMTVLVVTCLLLALVALGTGDYSLSVPEVVRAAFDANAGFAHTIVVEWRLPRVTVALAFGAALGLSGALFQSLTRNPLGSPDVIGFASGAYTGALIVLTVLPAGTVPTPVGALAGGIVTGLLVYALAWRGGVAGFRLIIVGIALTAFLQAVNVWLRLRADLEVAMAAAAWGAGSTALVGWGSVVPALILLAACLPLVFIVRGPLRQLELGDDAARSHGVPVEPARLAVIVIGVALTAVPTAVVGPIAFVALAAPQIARRLIRSSGVPLAASALTGALTLLAADFVAQHLVPDEIPVGIVTIIVGGVYLLWLLVSDVRRRS